MGDSIVGVDEPTEAEVLRWQIMQDCVVRDLVSQGSRGWLTAPFRYGDGVH